MFQVLADKGYDVLTLHHAEAILQYDFPEAADEIVSCLEGFEIRMEEIVSGGGGEATLTQRLRNTLATEGWVKRNIEIKKFVGEALTESLSHEIDHVKDFPMGTIALELEWNNKDPFFDRDLENFQRLHSQGAISMGVIVTRGSSFQEEIRDRFRQFALRNGFNSIEDLEKYGYDPTKRQRAAIDTFRQRNDLDFATAWSHHFTSDKFGTATTHWAKLEDRVTRGVGNPCPLILLGIPINALSD